MIKPDERVLRALCNLTQNPDFTIVRDWMEESFQQKNVVLQTAGEPHVLFKAQGAVAVMVDFIKYSSQPREFARKLAK